MMDFETCYEVYVSRQQHYGVLQRVFNLYFEPNDMGSTAS